MSKNYLDELNEIQREAVVCTEGPVMIVAGAGSGKTRVLTYRIAHLIQKGTDPFNILALTFTNKAAKEMKIRISKIVSESEARNLWMGTFHSVFARILRSEATRLGYPSNFTIYDTDDSKNLIKDILKELGLDEKIYKPGLVYNRISAAKNNLISAQAYAMNNTIADEDRQSGKPKLNQVYERYSRRCFKAGAMDFDDLLFNTNVLLRDFPEVLYKYQDKFRYIMVDEYQDTNFSQYVIVKQLAARFENICVVGDDAQSIYSFRGANIQNILNFEKDYPDMKTFKLEQNYRSTQNIVNAANSIIANNKDQIEKKVWTSNSAGDRIVLMKANTDNEEGQLVARSIFETKMNNQAHNKAFAILYRTNAQSRAMEEALRKMNIPYRIYGGLSFYQRKEVKDLLAYFRLAINLHDEESLKRVINYPARGIGDTTIQKLMLAATDHDVSIWTILDNMGDFNLSLNSGTMAKLGDFVVMVKNFNAGIHSQNAYELGMNIANSCGLLRELYTDKTPEGVSRYENVQELLNGLKEFTENGVDRIELPDDLDALPLPPPEGDNNLTLSGIDNSLFPPQEENTETLSVKEEAEGKEAPAKPKRLNEFMQDIALLTDSDKQTDEQGMDKVSLMTIHAAKGLEFPYVYIVGLEENLFPSQMALNSRTDLEEERRLFYVALTRAEKQAFLSFSITRYRWGNLVACEPSRFIEEIADEFIEFSPSVLREKPGTAPRGFGLPQRAQNRTSDKEYVYTKATAPVIKKNLVKLNTAVNNSSGAAYDNTHLRSLATGMTVMHERFGKGTVTNLEGEFPNSKATIQFETVGVKQLLLKFAKLNIIQ
ncbi:MAG TPA: UvrD-helicase domain-containing protein [Bacteroidia bacterium]|nr:UvrD-helicase domain-containing protein [Bacteroidia bacterium]